MRRKSCKNYRYLALVTSEILPRILAQDLQSQKVLTKRSYTHFAQGSFEDPPANILKRSRSCTGSAKISLREIFSLQILNITLLEGVLEGDPTQRSCAETLHRYLVLVLHIEIQPTDLTQELPRFHAETSCGGSHKTIYPDCVATYVFYSMTPAQRRQRREMSHVCLEQK